MAVAEKVFCSWNPKKHVCAKYHVDQTKRISLSVCGALAVFLFLIGQGIIAFGWENYWNDPGNWVLGLIFHGGICLIGAIIMVNLDESSEWKYVAGAMGFPAIFYEAVSLGQSGLTKAFFG